MGRGRPHGSRRRPGRAGHKKRKVLLTGTLEVLSAGRAVVRTPEGEFGVARTGLREAMNGDEVQVSLAGGRGRERVAYVQAVLQRATTTFLGTYADLEPLGAVVALDARIRRDFFVLPDDKSAQRQGAGEGDVVLARIVEYPSRQSAGVVTIVRRVGGADELDLNMEAVVASHGLATAFPTQALEEARAMRVDAAGALAADPRRRDLRGGLAVTIDPADARDFDDAVAARKTSDGFELEVHIADVSHYVGWGSSIDNEAKQRACSAYLADRVIPMLPEELCNDVCSLRPHEDRLCMSVVMRLSARGVVRGHEVFASVIRSRARLSYEQVDAFLGGDDPRAALPEDAAADAEVQESLRVLDEVARLREERRRERGSIDFQTSEAKVELDEHGKPVGVKLRQKTRATALVEEAMLLANECVAELLWKRGVPAAYRVHEQPLGEDLLATLPVLREVEGLDGEVVAGVLAADPHAIQAALDAARGTTSAFLVNSVLLRAQRRAVYAPQNDGHYALGARAYCHFTSPIRRYPDVIVHRAVKALLAGSLDTREQQQVARELPQLCRTCSERERAADAASRDSQKIKLAELYEGKVGQCFSGVVVGCASYGLFVMLDDTCAEGMLRVRDLGPEWFFFDEKRLQLVGEESGRVWRPGQRVAVKVSGVDVPRGRIDFVMASGRADA